MILFILQSIQEDITKSYYICILSCNCQRFYQKYGCVWKQKYCSLCSSTVYYDCHYHYHYFRLMAVFPAEPLSASSLSGPIYPPVPGTEPLGVERNL